MQTHVPPADGSLDAHTLTAVRRPLDAPPLLGRDSAEPKRALTLYSGLARRACCG